MKGVLKILYLAGLVVSVAAAVIYYFTNEAERKRAQTEAARSARWKKEDVKEGSNEKEKAESTGDIN
jgi:flagellar basal body-associated protein FliL